MYVNTSGRSLGCFTTYAEMAALARSHLALPRWEHFAFVHFWCPSDVQKARLLALVHINLAHLTT